MYKPFLHGGDKTIIKSAEKLNVNLKLVIKRWNVGLWCPSYLESIHLCRFLPGRECHRDFVINRHCCQLAGVNWSCHDAWLEIRTIQCKCRGRKQRAPTLLTHLGLFFRAMCSGHSSRWTSVMGLQCPTSTWAPWRMESNTSIRMWAFSEWPCRWTTVWGLTAPSCTYM